MKTIYILGFVLVAYLAIGNCAPLFSDEIEKLFESFQIDCSKKFNCPQGTSSCSKNVKTSEDKKKITTEIKCFGADNQLLNEGDTITEKQNDNPNSIQQSYEYYGSFTGGSNTVHTTNYGNSNPSNDNVETFSV